MNLLMDRGMIVKEHYGKIYLTDRGIFVAKAVRAQLETVLTHFPPVRIDMTEEERANVARIVGMGALKYFILKVDARKNMLFNPEESIDFNGNTGPFIQYTYARIRSIMRKAAEQTVATVFFLQRQDTPTGPERFWRILHGTLHFP